MSSDSYLGFIRSNAPFLLVAAMMLFMSSVGQTFVIAVFAGEIRTEFGITNGQWGLIYMVGTAASALTMIFVGGLTDRFRVRSLGVTVLGLLALSCIAMAVNTHIAGLVLVIFALRFFGQSMTSHTAIAALSRWFVATRGRALAIATIGFVIAEATLPVATAWLKTFVHWRTIWVGFACFILLMLPFLWRLLRLERTPQAVAMTSDAVGMDGRHWTRSEALRHPLFWVLAPSMTLFPMFATAFWFHQVHFAEIKGWDYLLVVAVFPLGTFAFMGSTFLFGWAVDRFGAGRLLPIYLLPYTIAFILHAFAPTIAWTAVGVILMGLSGGGQATLPPSVWSTYFGTAHIGSIKSATTAMMILGSAIGPGLSGVFIDLGFGFEQQLLLYASTFVVASAAMIIPLQRATQRLPATA